jgi:TonB family protein
MFLKRLRKYFTKTMMLFFLFFTVAFAAQAGPKTFAYIGKNYAITAEAGGPHSFVLNFINLSDFVIVIQPSEFIYKAASGSFCIGQVFQQGMKDARGEAQKYSASFLLKGHLFVGLTIVGAFREQNQIEELSVRIGAKRFYLQPMEKAAFDQLAAKIGSLDLSNPNAEAALAAAGIAEMGTVKNTNGTSEWDRDWQGLIGPLDGMNPPKVIERPEIEATVEAKKARNHGKVMLSAIINKSGGIQDLKVSKGLNASLDQRAMEGVRNSWLFLPATRNGEVLETFFAFEVDFPDPEKKQ